MVLNNRKLLEKNVYFFFLVESPILVKHDSQIWQPKEKIIFFRLLYCHDLLTFMCVYNIKVLMI